MIRLALAIAFLSVFSLVAYVVFVFLKNSIEEQTNPDTSNPLDDEMKAAKLDLLKKQAESLDLENQKKKSFNKQ